MMRPPVGTPRRGLPVRRSAQDEGWHDDDPVQMGISAANTYYPAGTHRTGQFKESERTPGPGAYRTQSCFPSSSRREAHAQRHSQKRGPAWRFNSRPRGHVSSIGPDYIVNPPINSIFRRKEGGPAPPLFAQPGIHMNTMPPVHPDGKILKGHSGTTPRGDGPPF